MLWKKDYFGKYQENLIKCFNLISKTLIRNRLPISLTLSQQHRRTYKHFHNLTLLLQILLIMFLDFPLLSYIEKY